MDTTIKFTTVATSATLSEVFQLRAALRAALWVPVVTSCAAYIQASIDATSANFFRVQNTAGSGDFTLALGPGAKVFALTEQLDSLRYARIEFGVAQTAARSLAVLNKI